MKQMFSRVLSNVDLLVRPEFKKTLPTVSCMVLQRRGGKTHLVRGGPPIKTHETKEWAHKWYKWNYERLPTQTCIDEDNPQFAIRPPEFRLPKKRGRLARKIWRQRIAEIESARHDPELEKLSRDRKLIVDIDGIEKEWCNEFGLIDINNLSRIYGINSDLFDNKDIVAETWLDVMFGQCKIHRGNVIEPSELLCPPTDVKYMCNEDFFTTLVLTNLDGHPIDSSKEILHWLVCNIPRNKISEGNTIMEYIPPFPWKGTGFHRLVFTLYRHNNPIASDNIVGHSKSLRGRTFSSLGFTSCFDLTPVGLAWCQVQWDESVKSTCSLLTDLNGEPVFELEEYIEPKEELKLLKIQASELRYRNM